MTLDPITKTPGLVADPPAVVTPMGPLTAPAGTVAVICVEEFTTTELAGVPPNVTVALAVKFAPVMVIREPTTPLLGVKLLMVGAGGCTVSVNIFELPCNPA
jgi:hypothetical protein